MNYIRTNWLPILVILIGFAASLAIAIAPLSFLLANTVADDSFYYFQVARNIVHGLGSTFDGVNLTNGYHPLWMLILLPIFKYFSSPIVMDVAPVHAALVLSAVFNAALGFVLLAIISRYTSSTWIKAIALGVWFLNPYNLFEMADGLETALSMLCIGFFILFSLRFSERKSALRLIMAGVIGGLMMLARLDNVFYFLMLLAWLLYERGFPKGVREILLVGAVASVVVSPWLIFNYLTFGMIFTSASIAYTIVNHRIIYQDNGHSLFQMFKAAIFMTDYSVRQFVVPQTGAPSVFFTLLGVTFGWFLYTEGRLRTMLKSVPLELFLAVGFALNFIVNASIRWSPREWYFIAFNLFLTLWIAWLLEKLRERQKLRFEIVSLVALFTLSLFFISWSKNLRSAYNTSNQMLAAILWTNENLPKNATIGAFNAGIEGYFSSHTVINLDGLINNHAYEAIRDRRLWSYIQSEHIDYIVDQGDRINYRMTSSLGITNVLDHLEAVHETAGGPTTYKLK